MPIKVCIDGSIHDERDARVSVFDRGFLYGDSVFEVMRTYHGVPFARDEHLTRLRASAEKILIPVPVSDDVLREEIARTLAAARNEESYVRVIVTRGTGPLNYDPTTAKDPLRVIIVKQLDPQPASLYADGVSVVCIRAARPVESGRAVGTKASNYLANLLAVHDARERGGYEAILLGAGGEVLEGASSNVFAVSKGVVRTPRLESGILAGITRATVIAAARVAGIELVETALFPRDLYDADEAFITSSLREVVPVVRVDAEAVGDGRPGAVTCRLHEAFRAEVARRITASD
jgi:branched-chain amino acid aminotransferase